MNSDIVIVREENAYRLLHGHLRLANLLKTDGEVWVPVAGDALADNQRVKVVQSPRGYLVSGGPQHFPLLGA